MTVLVGSDPLMRTNCTTQNLTTTTTTTELVETTPTTITVSVTSQTVLAGDPSSGKTKSSKSQVILAVSLSSIALLLIIVVAVGIAAIRKRRYATVCFRCATIYKSSKSDISYSVNNLTGKDLHGIQTRNSNHYRLPKVKTNWGKQMSSYLFIDEWNKLNANVKLAAYFDIFKQTFWTSF